MRKEPSDFEMMLFWTTVVYVSYVFTKVFREVASIL